MQELHIFLMFEQNKSNKWYCLRKDSTAYQSLLGHKDGSYWM